MAALAEKAMVAEWSSGKCNCGLRVHVPSLRHGGKPSDLLRAPRRRRKARPEWDFPFLFRF